MMNIINKTSLNIEKFNAMVGMYAEQSYPMEMPKVTSYEDFALKYLPVDKLGLMSISDKLVLADKLTSCYVISTSGTTSRPLVLVSRIFRDVTENSYPYQVRGFMAEHVFCENDTVVNLLTAGCLGYNYEGMCRLLEPIGATVLPVGRPDVMNNMPHLLRTMARFKANVLVGSPTGIIQIAQAAESLSIDLLITKIVFVGEAFHPSKREFIQRLWPRAEFYSLYGATEFGFAAVNTPSMMAHNHLILSNWFFIEQASSGELLVTDLKSPVVPIIRYRIGDIGEIIQEDCDKFYLKVGSRAAEEFSLGGHRISLKLVEQALIASGVSIETYQVKLSIVEGGKDCLTIILDMEDSKINRAFTMNLERCLLSISRLREAVIRGVSVIEWRGREQFIYSPRGKLNRLLDSRNSALEGQEF
ncbi:AMP-binding protein [Pseudomonas poae]|uniref:AMP-dependent synthetase/ligase domain-containing protein n=1 Tax=Pseudomonas poae TaxID=200451 RepID=A0A2S9EF11_9PSED|nr:AMP-binding protein [Pseudomonas poae]PRA27253.1 hypothetical protein CQZ97_18195 [Pseudomonas poae]PRC13657.1 hypothetical protein CQZ99_21110 [Pseudomonas poae]